MTRVHTRCTSRATTSTEKNTKSGPTTHSIQPGSHQRCGCTRAAPVVQPPQPGRQGPARHAAPSPGGGMRAATAAPCGGTCRGGSLGADAVITWQRDRNQQRNFQHHWHLQLSRTQPHPSPMSNTTTPLFDHPLSDLMPAWPSASSPAKCRSSSTRPSSSVVWCATCKQHAREIGTHN